MQESEPEARDGIEGEEQRVVALLPALLLAPLPALVAGQKERPKEWRKE